MIMTTPIQSPTLQYHPYLFPTAPLLASNQYFEVCLALMPVTLLMGIIVFLTYIMNQSHKKTCTVNILENYVYEETSDDDQSTSSDTESCVSEPEYNVNCEDVPNNLDDRMKFYERKTAEHFLSIPAYFPFIIRLDGRAFSGLFSALKSWEWANNKIPYSTSFQNAMIETAKDLLYEFSPSTVYTHSDEITMIFPALCTYEEFKHGVRNDGKRISGHMFDGQLYKLLSIIPSFTSTRFTYHLQRELKSNPECSVKFFGSDDSTSDELSTAKRTGPIFAFDARPIVFPHTKTLEIVNHMIWRSKLDCFRNFVAMYAERMLPARTLHGLKNCDRVTKLKELGVDMDSPDINPLMKNGAYVKKKLFNQNSGSELIFRRKSYVFALPNIKCDAEHLDLLLSRHLEKQEI